MNWIKVYCHTNLDEFAYETWPKVLTCRPDVGDYVRSNSGKTLKVVRVVHTMEITSNSERPCLEVELHK